VVTLEVEAEELGQVDNIAQTIRVSRNNAGEDLASLDSLILSQNKIVPFIEMIESLGKQMNLEIKTSSVSTDETNVFIVIEADGEWARSMNFIHALESLPLKAVIDEATTNLLGDGSQGWHTRVAISLPFVGN